MDERGKEGVTEGGIPRASRGSNAYARASPRRKSRAGARAELRLGFESRVLMGPGGTRRGVAWRGSVQKPLDTCQVQHAARPTNFGDGA